MVDETETTSDGPSTFAVGVGQVIDNTAVINEFTNIIRNIIVNAEVWYKEMVSPSQADYFPTQILNARNPGGPVEADLTAIVTANGIANAFGGWVKQYTAIRNLRWIRIYVQNPYAGNYANIDQTNLSSLLPNSTEEATLWINGSAGVTGATLAGSFFTLQTASNQFSSVNTGTSGNTISLVFDGIQNVNAVVTNWNTANPTNLVTITSGSGTIVPTAQTVTFSGGTSVQGTPPTVAKGFATGRVQYWYNTGATAAPAIGTNFLQVQVLVAAGDTYGTLCSKTSTAIKGTAAGAYFSSMWEGPMWNYYGVAAHTCSVLIDSSITTLTVNPQINGGTLPNQGSWTGVVNTATTPYQQSSYDTTINAAAVNNGIVLPSGEPLSPLATATNFNNYLVALYGNWNTAKNNSATYTTYYCHTNCHSNCHGSRTWR